MKTSIYAVMDRKLGELVSRSLGLSKSDEVLVREIRQSWRVPGQEPSFLERAPEDYDMMCLGTLDVESGQITTTVPHVVFNFSQLDREVTDAARG